MENPRPEVETLERFFHLMNAQGAMRVYHEALGSGLLTTLAQEPRSGPAAAQACGLADEPTRLMIDVLVAMGLVEARGSAFAATQFARILLSGPYRTLGDLYWGHLGTFMRTDVPMARMDSTAESATHYAVQAEALAWMSDPAAACAARHLVPLAGGGRLLDVGAGSAIWSLTIASQVAGATVTAVDWRAVLSVAVKVAARMGLAERLILREGNYHGVPLEAGAFDLAIAANVTHLETEAGVSALFRRVHAALKPGGHLAVIDIMPGQAAGDLNRALYALGLALRTEQARVHTTDALKKMLLESGFAAAEFVPLDVVPHAFGMLLAQRA